MLHQKTLDQYCKRMLEMIEKIERYVGHINDFDEFLKDEKNLDLVFAPLMQIGELA